MRIFTFFAMFAPLFSNGQTTSLRVNSNIVLPKDSIESKVLIASLNNFLIAAQLPNEENNFVFESEKIETFILLDEIKGIEKSGKYKDNNFYQPYLTNVVHLKDGNYFLQVSYIGISDKAALLRAGFEFIGHKANNSFTFSSLLLGNTKNWKIEKAGDYFFHYPKEVNKAYVKKLNKLTSSIDSKIKSAGKLTNYPTKHIIDIYCCENLIELEKLIGINYKSDYNGIRENALSSSYGKKMLIVYGENFLDFIKSYEHDLFHDRLSLRIDRGKVDNSVDEGCAYLYGGSWGISWPEILKSFKEQIAINKKTNWAEIKETPVYFKTKEFYNSVDNIVNALIVQQIEKEKGFAGVWELLNVGPSEKGNEKYYKKLESLIGITKANYNEKIWELINSQE